MFFTEQKYWEAAVFQERKWWDCVDPECKGKISDRDFLTHFSENRFDRDLIRKFAYQYGVARSFNADIYDMLWNALRSANVDSPSENESFNKFVRLVRTIAHQVQQATPKGVRPLSGVSKLLWQRFPSSGFLYDRNARLAVMQAGLVAPFVFSLPDWGLNPIDDRETDFLIFTAAHFRFCRPLHVLISQALPDDSPKQARAARIVDKVLWIAGTEGIEKRNEKLRLHKNANKNDIAIATVGRAEAERLLDRLRLVG